MAEEKTNVISEDIQKRLDQIDWKKVEETCGVTRETIERNPAVARQLVYGQYTELVHGTTSDLSGEFSLRAFPTREGEPWKVKAYTKEAEKTLENAFTKYIDENGKEQKRANYYLYGSPIYSESAIKALCEKTSWKGLNGQDIFGYANANAGRPIAVEKEVDGEKKKEYYIASIHRPTNRIVGMPVDAVKKFFEQGEKSMYGVKITDEQVKALCEGKAAHITGCKTKDGKEFSCFVQFDAAQRQIVPVHPTWLKEAQKAGVDLGVSQSENKKENKAAKKTERPAQSQGENKPKKMKVSH